MESWLRRLAVPAFVAIFATLTIHSYTQKSATFDEPLHLLAGYAALHAGDFRVDPTHPPLARMWAALPLLAFDQPELGLEQIDAMRGRDWLQRNTRASQQFLFRDNDGDRMLYAARAMMVALGVMLGLLLSHWARLLMGERAALVVLAAYCMTPTVLAHSTLVTTDLPITLATCAAVYCAWRFVRDPTGRWMTALAVTTGVAVATKFSGVLLLPIVMLLLGLGAWSRRSPLRWPQAGLALLVIALTTWLVVWGAYGFRYAPGPSSTWLFHADRLPMVQQHFGGWLDVVMWVDARRLLPNAFTHGALLADASVVQLPAYLAGAYSPTGWWYYFPAAFLIKAPVVLVLLSVGGLLATLVPALRQPLTQLHAWFLLVPVSVIGGVAMASGINLGVRHILPIYPFLLLAAAKAVVMLLGRRQQVVRWVLVAAGVYWAVQVGRGHPHHLAFMSSAVGGAERGAFLLADSNIDWGQDLKALKSWMDRAGVDHINLAYFGTADPAYYGIEWTPLPGSGLGQAGRRPVLPGYVAISATMQSGVYLPRRWRLFLRGFRRLTPDAEIGRTIRVYWVEEWPEAPPPAEWTADRLAATRGLAESLAAWEWWDHAVTHFTTYLRHRPDDVAAMAGLVSALVQSGRGADALTYVAEARARMPRHPALHDLYGRLLATQDRRADAIRAFKRAAELDPGWAAPREALRMLESAPPAGGGKSDFG